ncbi:CDP-diacylglycerol--glycerol-3-phosphate 3-phosphatidyltransferase [Jatrophihabitans sp. GAS493]|uniref:phosphatidylinositol phosphate synthase n=1 Tax=Jatrophihabitans sp. GAS493 TaxID=1907575 RepID=UPI000BB78430|nr:CDP-alcohol phosphatidyltransferase family protein [Jatrophihabitans sp. GAS493]SOD74277.1 CDP-diacylglycerol--glycerol-3-phosphate 3-phosphatidyltransferase [Jatrophihabitans sp. GAS493]
MITARLRLFFSRFVNPLAATLARLGVTPDVITIFGTIGATASAVIFFTRGWWFLGTLLIWGFVMLDMVDGAVARVVGSTKFGAVLDSTTDRLVDASVFATIAWYFSFGPDPQKWMVLACLLCLILGALTSYIKARAEGVGLTCNVGIAERTERLIIVLVGTGVSGAFLGLPFAQAVALWLLVAASAITVVQRLATVHTQSRQLAA